MYENVNKAMAKQKVALEVRNVVRLVIHCIVKTGHLRKVQFSIFHRHWCRAIATQGDNFENLGKHSPLEQDWFFYRNTFWKKVLKTHFRASVFWNFLVAACSEPPSGSRLWCSQILFPLCQKSGYDLEQTKMYIIKSNTTWVKLVWIPGETWILYIFFITIDN